MRKVLFYFMLLLSVAVGSYLGFAYPPETIKQEATAIKDTILDTVPVELFQQVDETILPIASDAPNEADNKDSDIPALPSIQADAENTAAPTIFNANGILGHLVVGKYSVTVRDNVDANTLDDGPGWMPDSALPGREGMSVILGHRNRKHLKLIEDVQVGDAILFRYLDNSTVSYTVSDVQIFESTADWALPVTDENVLVLVTCYPFQYTGNAPGKFVVVAHLSEEDRSMKSD